MGCLYSSAQAGEPISFGLYSSLDFCYRRLTNHSDQTIIPRIITIRNDSEKFRIGYSIGGLISKPFNHFSLECGVLYASKGYQLPLYTVTTASNPDGVNGKAGVAKYHFNYLDIPIKFYRTFKRQNISYRMGVGFVNSLYINNVSKAWLNEGERTISYKGSDKNTKFNAYHASLTASFGIIKSLNDNFSFAVDIKTVYGLTTIYEAPIHQMLWDVGLAGSLYYRLD